MKLESVLSNLTDYVEMGVAFYNKKDSRDYGTLNDEMNRLTDWFYTRDIVRWLDNNDSDVKDYVTEIYSLEDLIDGYDSSYILEYVSDNLSLRDLVGCFDTSDILEEYDISDIKDYLLSCYSYDDILEGFDSNRVKRWLNSDDETLDEILKNIDLSDLREYISDNYCIDDFIDIDWRSY